MDFAGGAALQAVRRCRRLASAPFAARLVFIYCIESYKVPLHNDSFTVFYPPYLASYGMDDTELALDLTRGVPIASLCLALLAKVLPNRPGDLDLLLDLREEIIVYTEKMKE